MAEYTITASTGTGYEITNLTSPIIAGEETTFDVELEDNYSKSEIVVKANDEVLTKGEDGHYHITNIQENITITVSGVTLNTWEVRYYALNGDKTPFATKEVTVGEEIPTDIGTPTREGYVFKGWSISFEEMPNSSINVYAEWEEASSSSELPDNPNNPSDPSEPTTPEETPLNVPAIVGGTIGGVLGVALIAGAIIYFIHKSKQTK